MPSMSMWTILQAVCLVGSLSTAVPESYEDDIEVGFGDNYFNEITEEDKTEGETPTASPEPCKAPAFTNWDKLFTMLENSQMKENMLLQYANDIIKVDLQTLRGEMLQFLAQYGGFCASAVESTARRARPQTEMRLQNALEGLQKALAEQYAQHDTALQQLLTDSGNQVAQLERLENSCLKCGREGLVSEAKSFQAQHLIQELTEIENGGRFEKTLATISSDLQAIQEQLNLYTRSDFANMLPSGCDTGLIFPMRSSRNHVEVSPKRPFQTNAVTICLWVKPTQVINKSVLFSYGTTGNPHELQLVLNEQSVLFTVDGETHLVEASGAVQEGQWVHLCAVWSSQQGLTSLWVNGQQAANSPGVAEGHELQSKGSILLGQEYGRYFRHLSVQDTFDVELAFTGKMTGVNMWDRVLDSKEISQQARVDGSGCGIRGNVVAWGVSDIDPKGSVKIIY
ncbi:pentraxin-related protein PTX3-like [Xyrauchen texanus]|uniref:pentraxin-related protein PTX3-like n=1 Tax=Xyrauchen texanus TaxID=154827 RepID=UPI0022423521|nr:pentraxin-related protein PTX3-like [Xyrauchen texanus]